LRPSPEPPARPRRILLLTRRPPFDGQGGIGLLIAQSRDPVVASSQVRTGIPEDLERVVMQCLAMDAADRLPDAESLENVLGEWT
jgi:hypothetical protein